jgi:uncharacterized protein DUF1399
MRPTLEEMIMSITHSFCSTSFESKLERLDLQPIIFKLVYSPEGPKWTMKRAEIAAAWYKRFHKLIHAFPDRALVPTQDVDQFWHAHILDTRKYHDDCIEVHGYFIHHFPYLGLRGEKDRALLFISFKQTMQLFQDVFGESPSDAAIIQLLDDPGAICASGCAIVNDGLVDLQNRPSLLPEARGVMV